MPDFGEKKDCMVRVRVATAHKELWERAADKDRRNLSEWLRWLAEIRVAERERLDARPDSDQ